MNELIGPLGLPGAVVAVMTAIWIGIKIRDAVTTKPPEEGQRPGVRMSIEEYQELQKTRERIDAAASVIVADVSRRHHDIRGLLGTMTQEIQMDVREVREVVERIERFLLAGPNHQARD